MAYRLVTEPGEPTDWGSLLDGILLFWNTIDDQAFEPGYGSWEFLLYERSGLEFMRAQLTDGQRAELDQVDAYWRSKAQAFNNVFRLYHGRNGKPYANKSELDGWVADENGKVPSIPESHWWWWPIRET